MGSSKSEIIKMLKAAGFKKTMGSKHEIWVNGDTKIVASKGSVTSRRIEHLVRSQLRKLKAR